MILLRQNICHCLAKLFLIFSCKKCRQFWIHPVLFLLAAKLIRLIQAAGSDCFLLWSGHIRVHRSVYRCDHIYSFPVLCYHSLSCKNQLHIHLLSGIHICLGKSFHVRAERGNTHASKSGNQRNGSIFIGLRLGNWIIFSHVQNLELHLGLFHRSTCAVCNLHSDLLYLGITCSLVQHNSCTLFADHILSLCWEKIKQSGMDHHCSGGSIGKPTFVQNHKGLARSCEIPLSIAPQLYPCMVVITV